MHDYIVSFEEIVNCLSGMKSEIAEEMQVAMVLASFGDKNKYPFGHVIASLTTIQDKLEWETATASLLQEYEYQLLRAGGPKERKSSDEGRALAASSGGRHYRSQRNQRLKKTEKLSCYECRKVGHISRDCPMKDSKTRKHVAFGDETGSRVDTPIGRAQQAQLLIARQDISDAQDNIDAVESTHERAADNTISRITAIKTGECDLDCTSHCLIQRCPSSTSRAMNTVHHNTSTGNVFLLDSGASV